MMVDLGTISKIAIKWGEANWPRVGMCPPEAKVITGNPISDAQFYYFEEESGIVLKLTDNFNKIVDYDIVDEQKFTAFLLRWA
jgi:hypothetical protein